MSSSYRAHGDESISPQQRWFASDKTDLAGVAVLVITRFLLTSPRVLKIRFRKTGSYKSGMEELTWRESIFPKRYDSVQRKHETED